ncbi:TPA: hypothetical protein QCU53_002226 [Bacillus thuringiensis]|nr:hypothetical protein [Bacillus thuringiensis]
MKEECPIPIYFKVKPHESWDEVTKERVKKHFTRFKLGQLYSSYASEEFSGKVFYLKRPLNVVGLTMLKKNC